MDSMFLAPNGTKAPDGYVNLSDLVKTMKPEDFDKLLRMYNDYVAKLSAEYGPWQFEENVRGYLQTISYSEKIDFKTAEIALGGFLMMLQHYRADLGVDYGLE